MDGLIAYALSKKYADAVGEKVAREGFRVQVEDDRSILETAGQEKIFYFLPKTTSKPEDGYDEYIWTTDQGWEQVGVTDVDLSAYALKSDSLAGYGITDGQTKIDSNNKLLSDLVDDTSQINKFVTTENKASWDAKYDKPATGIPKTDLDSGVQASLSKADTAIQDISTKADKATTLAGYGITDAQIKFDSSHKLSSDLVDDTNNTNKFVTSADITAWNAKYDKPSGGIPKTDLDSSVQSSLDKANTALQSEIYTGTVTGITMNGESKGTSGVVDLGTVITQHQDISGKEDKSNKVTAWQSTPDDTHYPSELLVKTSFTYIEEHFTKNPVLIYDKTNKMHVAGTINSGTDSTDGLINQAQGEGTSHDISSWNIENMDLSEFRYIRIVFRRNNASYACTGEFNIPLDCDPVATRNLFVSGYTSSVYGDRNRLLNINCAIDSNKSKFCVTQTISLYGTAVTVINDLFVEKLYGCY